MKININNLSFSYNNENIFENLNAQFQDSERPNIILGTSGSGKTTLLKLMCGLLQPKTGSIEFYDNDNEKIPLYPKTSFMFQDPRLLPWFTILENVRIPLEKDFGRKESLERAKYFLSLTGLYDKVFSFPSEISGGQAQRVSLARAFAWPSPLLFMDEPFQSLDIPIKLNLMDLCLDLISKEKRLVIAVSHDPREAIYLGNSIVIIGKHSRGIIYSKNIDIKEKDRQYGSIAAAEQEKEMIEILSEDIN